ncbi:hypothetical protein N0V90_009661 [Kalmusia sp. IMI 367209]|nr:hypothetical protein N0V90_009661 [Kalmusia sp. IMI 367209]
MLSSATLLIFLLPVLEAVVPLAHASPILQSSTSNEGRNRSPEFYEVVGSMVANSTADGHRSLQKRPSFSTSQDGVNGAGFYFTLYNDNHAGATYTEYNSGQFQLGWTTSVEFLSGKGYKGQTPKTLTWSGYFSATGDYTMAVYGWTTNPVTEWYIVEQHGTGTSGNGDTLGHVDTDGGVYDVYDLFYQNVPEIYGVTSFHQYWSVRRSARTTGSVTTGNHFQSWKNLGLDPGYSVFQVVTAEGFSGTGYLDFTVSY